MSFVEEFKKSLSATVKSIGKNNELEINYVKENPSITGNIINLTEPNVENIKNKLAYLRAEADSLALEFRLHSKEIHQNFINNDEISNEIVNALEQSRIEVKGSIEFKGIKNNLIKKHIEDISKNKSTNPKEIIIEAFRYVSYEELLEENLGENNNEYRKIIREKLKNNYDNFFKKLKKNINNQEKFTSTILETLNELGLLNKNNKNSLEEENNENEVEDKKDNNENENENNDNESEANIEMQSSETNIEQSLSIDENEEL